MLAKVESVDTQHRLVLTDRGAVQYDRLIVATGARHAYFGHDEWEEHARGIKKIDDATDLRRRVLMAFERAETEADAGKRRSLLTFVVVGGGPTGVEIAGALAELARKTLPADFRSIDPGSARIVLVEAGPRLLPSFAERLSEHALRCLEVLGVEVRLSSAVTDCNAAGVRLGAEGIESCTVIWAAGVRASPAGEWLGAETDRAGRVIVEPDLSVPGHPNVFVIGDAAHVKGESGAPLPGVATVAKQQGKYVAELLAQRHSTAPEPFRYRDPGSMATIGRRRAVAQIKGGEFTGFGAWLLWSFAHIYFLIGFRNRLSVGMSWLWSYFTYERGTRLITGGEEPAPVGDQVPQTAEVRELRGAA
jgi:NADH dehydrogenase